MVINNRLRAAGAIAALALAGSATAADFDGSRNLICAAIDVVACTEASQGPVCMQGHSRTFDIAEFFAINFSEKEIRATGVSSEAVSPIMNQEKTETQIVMQGVENNRGWSAILDRADGTLTLSTVGRDVSYMIFGACTAP